MKVSENYIAVPPGEEIKEQMGYRNMTQKELAEKTGLSENFITNLLEGDAPLLNEVAQKLETVFGIEAYFWNGLEEIYREDLEKVNKENSRNKEAKKRWKYGTSSERWGTLAANHI